MFLGFLPFASPSHKSLALDWILLDPYETGFYFSLRPKTLNHKKGKKEKGGALVGKYLFKGKEKKNKGLLTKNSR